MVCDEREQFSRGSQHTLTCQPLYVVVTFHNTTCPKLDGLPSKDIPIYPVTTSFSVRFPGAARSTSISRNQFPLVSAYAYTSYKSQAQTLEAAVIDLVVPDRMPVRDTSFAYVPLSRIRRLDDLAILRPFDIKVLQKGKTQDHQAQDDKFSKYMY